MLVALVAVSLLVLPLSPGLAEGLRVRVCKATGGSCGYQPAPVKCTVLARDSGIAAGLAVLSSTRRGGDAVRVDKLVDGSAAVTLARPSSARTGVDPEALVLGRLDIGQRSEVVQGKGSGPIAATYRFRRQDDADAWLDHYRRVDQPVKTAAAGPNGVGLSEGVRRAVRLLGFTDPDAVAAPDAVGLDVPRQATAAGSYLAASDPAPPDSAAAQQQPLPRLLLDASGRATTSGALPLADSQDEIAGPLATRLGLVADPTYEVSTDAAGRPVRLVVSGVAGQTVDGGFLAAQTLPVREQGDSRGPGAQQAALDAERGVRTRQSVVLDLRGESNRAAFDGVFLASGALNLARPEPTARAVQALVGRMASDAVVVRTTTRTVGDLSTLVSGYSQDLAVPASRMTRLPGCSQ